MPENCPILSKFGVSPHMFIKAKFSWEIPCQKLAGKVPNTTQKSHLLDGSVL
jgi:hypothetical protein